MIKDLFNKLFGNKSDSKDSTNNNQQKVVGTQVETPTVPVYEGTPGIRYLITKESPKQILSEDFPGQEWPISGGWGYTPEDAVVIELDDDWEGVEFEYKFLKYRTYEEAVIFRPKEQRLAGFQFESKMQSLHNGQNGRHYDEIIMSVTAYLSSDYEYLKNDWESHNAYEGDEVGKANHLQLAETKKIRYEIVGHFDITQFFGK